MDVTKNSFGADFAWGVAASAYQTEGAWQSDGKGKSIWDEFSNTKGKITDNQNGNSACNFYDEYPLDLLLMRQLQIKNFRFSISWSRILPGGVKHINQAGVDFYNSVIDLCLQLGIEPWITLYHWDLPLELEKKGGWTNRDVISWFCDYAALCIRLFGDRVKYWMILNEPLVFTGAGYFLGIHAPGRKSFSAFLSSVHHAAMCQAEGGRLIRSMNSTAQIGTTFSCSLVEPYSESAKDVLAANRVDALLNRLFVEPLAGLGYPIQELKWLNRIEKYIHGDDMEKLAFNMDFIGIQNYTREVAAHSNLIPFIWAKLIKAEKRSVETTDMKWEVYPESLYQMLHKFSAYKSFNQIIVTENGAAFPDSLKNGRINDQKRQQFIEQSIRHVLRSKQEGVKVKGYFIWTFIDNFEWAEGYKPRFGLIYNDFQSQKRIIKDSGYWFGQFLTQPGDL